MEFCVKYSLIFIFTFISVCIAFTIRGTDKQIDPGNKCRLQEQYCDLMDPKQQCCPGTSCGIKRYGDHVSNVCVVCRDLGQPCSSQKHCCSGLTCQMITEYASVCNPKSHKPFVPNAYTRPKDSDVYNESNDKN